MTGTFGVDPEFDAQIEEEYLKASAEGFKRSPGMPLRRSDESRPKPFRWPGLGSPSDTVSLPREDLDQIAADYEPRQQPAQRQPPPAPAQRQPPPAPEPPTPPTPPAPPPPPVPPASSVSHSPLGTPQPPPAPSAFAAPRAPETGTLQVPVRPQQPRQQPAVTSEPTRRGDFVSNETPTDETRVVSRSARSVVAPEWVLDMEGGPLLAMATTDVIVGRRPGAIPGCSRLTIEDPGRTLSKSHVRLTLRGETWFIEDLGSTNGSALITGEGSEQVLVPGEPVPVSNEFRLGTLLLRIRPLVTS